MFARFSHYQGLPNKVADGRRAFAEVTPELQQMPGFQRAYLLVDPKSGRAITLSIWNTEEEMTRSTSPASPLRDRVAKAIGETGQPKLEFYELGVEVAPKTEGARYARVSHYHGSPSKADDGIRTAKGNEPALKQVQGFQQAYLFVDRRSGNAISMTLWDSETALNRSSADASPLRDAIAQSLGSTGQHVGEHYEVVGEIFQRARRAA